MWNEICAALSLGRMLGEPEPLQGGYTHRMYALITDTGRYAVKLLNPEIMQRADALDNYRRAEQLEARLKAVGLPILPALVRNGHTMQCVQGQYLFVFDYFDGKPLSDADITPAHCRMIGAALARIHGIDRRELPAEERPSINWDELTDALLAGNESRAEGLLMRTNLAMLRRVTAAADAARRTLPNVQTICHNDMDAKNVLWRGDTYRIIDLECIDWADPMQELLDLAVSWAGYPLNERKFRTFVRAYAAAGGDLPADPAPVYDSRRNHLDWLAYNARRALLDDARERAVGREQIRETIDKIACDQRNRAQILRWMAEERAACFRADCVSGNVLPG